VGGGAGNNRDIVGDRRLGNSDGRGAGDVADDGEHLVGRDELVIGVDSLSGIAFIVVYDKLDLFAVDAAFGIDFVGVKLYGIIDRIAVDSYVAGKRCNHTDFNGVAAGSGTCRHTEHHGNDEDDCQYSFHFHFLP